MMRLQFPRLRPWFAVALCGTACLLAACDDQNSSADTSNPTDQSSGMPGLKDFINAIRPAQIALQSLRPGISTEADVRAVLGKPETERVFTDGSKRLEYPRGPMGNQTYFVDIDGNGFFMGATQVLTAENFAKIQPGMGMDEVRRLLGKPTQIARYPLKPETVWSWRWHEQGGFNEDGFFNVHFDANDQVYTTSRSDVHHGH